MTKEQVKQETKPMWQGGKPPEYYKHPQYGHVYGPTYASPSGRLVWPHLIKPKEGMKQADGTVGASRYEITQLLAKDDPRVKIFIESTAKLADYLLAVYNEGKKTKLSTTFDLKDGNTQDLEKYPFYKDMWILVARNAKQPICYDENKAETEPSKIMGGLIGKLLISPLITTHGVSFKLTAVQVLKDDKVRYGGGIKDFTELLGDDTFTEDSEKQTKDKELEGDSAPSSDKGKALALNLL